VTGGTHAGVVSKAYVKGQTVEFVDLAWFNDTANDLRPAMGVVVLVYGLLLAGCIRLL
jgi:hypothetical protein